MDEETRKAIGAGIKQARKALGLKQLEIAREFGIGRSQFCNIEKGKTIPAYLLIWFIDKKVSIDWIFSGIGEMFLIEVRFEKERYFLGSAVPFSINITR